MPALPPSPADCNRKNSVVILEDDKIYGKVLEFQLRASGFESKLCGSTNALFNHIKTHGNPDIFILDYFLGDEEPTGLEICRRVVTYFNRPAIMLTGNDNVETLVSCLTAGADQYIVKPCDVRELVARIEVTLRRQDTRSSYRENSLTLPLDENISISWENESLQHSDGRISHLTQKELGLLELFLREQNRYIDRRKAFMSLYGYEMDPLNRSIDVLVSRIRKKLRELDDDYRIKTLRGHGYVLYKKK
ncbi:response regulator transcription factor [Pseudohongiella spirulinae]|uniref:Uncharacterized protein n=1 Tax=Pseudohongiella spirulinae TaxID=1249552 RepID=A0A0S2KFZ9_9GAMM|nr:response regulator transcription factor [Pseudohongiella spirulinae]ALO47038.1 hypothetical protein PS2015_2404 [Pseudohongiella spirulinae]